MLSQVAWTDTSKYGLVSTLMYTGETTATAAAVAAAAPVAAAAAAGSESRKLGKVSHQH